MKNRNGTDMILPLVLVLFVGLPRGLEAEFIKSWQLKETATAPVLVVGRVLNIRKNERMPSGSLPWEAETWAKTAEIDVLRSYNNSGERITANRILVHFLEYGPSVTGSINGFPPLLPSFEPGQVLILPLQENTNAPATEWRLVADSGMNLIVPSHAENPDSGSPPATARVFLCREIANTLGRGTVREVAAAAQYLAGQYEDLSGEQVFLLESASGDDRQRWTLVASSLLAASSTPTSGIQDLISGKTRHAGWPSRGNLILAQTALQKLEASADTDRLLITNWIPEAPWLWWGSAICLREYADNPVTTDGVRKALGNDLTGSSFIALELIGHGNKAILPSALARALKVVDRPAVGSVDLPYAAALLRDYGSDQELDQFAALVRKYQTRNREFYDLLWQYATESGNRREVRVLAVVLGDRRTVLGGGIRYCDSAVRYLEKAVGQHFGSGGETLQERDAAVSRADAWVKAQGFSRL